MNLERECKFSLFIPVRISDINYGKHLGHTALISIIHETRARYFHHIGYEESNIHENGIILAEINIKFKSEAFYLEDLHLQLFIDDIGKKHFWFTYEVYEKNSKRHIATARECLVVFNYQEKKSAVIPEKLLEIFNEKANG